MGKLKILRLVLFTSVGVSLSAQPVTITVSDPRPVYAATLAVERLGDLPINYEDLRYDYAPDTRDVAASIMNAAQRALAPPTLSVIVPVGGTLSIPVTVDPTTKRLVDSLATSNALNSLIAAAGASGSVPGKFQVENRDGAFFVEPTYWHASNGAEAPAAPILAVPVTVSSQILTGWEALKAILAQVSKTTGFTVDIGTVPINALALSHVSITASAEPARYVIARLLFAVGTGGLTGPAQPRQSMSYHLLCDPISKAYALNVHVVPNLNATVPAPPSLLPQQPSSSRGFTKNSSN